MKWRGGGCLLHYTDSAGSVHILVGHETRYLADYVDESVISQKDLLAYQSVRLDFSEEEAYRIFSERAKELSKLQLFDEGLTHTVTFDAPTPTVDVWTVNMRILPRPPNLTLFGIPKGGSKPIDQTPQETACRELEEEIGVKVDSRRLNLICQDRMYHFFSSPLNTEDIEQIRWAVNHRQESHYCELQDVQFLALEDAAARFTEFNGMTRKVIREFLRLHHPDILARYDLEPI